MRKTTRGGLESGVKSALRGPGEKIRAKEEMNRFVRKTNTEKFLKGHLSTRFYFPEESLDRGSLDRTSDEIDYSLLFP